MKVNLQPTFQIPYHQMNLQPQFLATFLRHTHTCHVFQPVISNTIYIRPIYTYTHPLNHLHVKFPPTVSCVQFLTKPNHYTCHHSRQNRRLEHVLIVVHSLQHLAYLHCIKRNTLYITRSSLYC